MILSAGLGKRLAPLTLRRAKPSIPFLNTPFLVGVIQRLARAGISELIVNVHHMPDSIRALSARFPARVKVRFLEEKNEILGTAGGLKNAEAFLSGGTFFLVNSDILFSIDLQKALHSHRTAGALATLVLRGNPDPQAFPPVVTDRKGRVVQVAGRPQRTDAQGVGTRHMFTGIHVIEPDIFKYIPAGRPVEIIGEVYPELIARGYPVNGYVTDEFWCEAGTRQRFLDSTRAAIEAGQCPGPLLDETARVHSGARVDRFCVIGPGARVRRGATVSHSVLLERVEVGEGAAVERAILDADVQIPPGGCVTGQCLSRDPVSGVLDTAPIA